MKKHLMTLAAVIILAGIAGPAAAWHDDGNARIEGRQQRWEGPRGGYQPAYAKVVAVRPIVRMATVTVPRQTCWNEEVVQHRPADPVPTVVGGMVGGIIGHQIGSGQNRGVATVAGAVLGAAIGNDIGRNRSGGRAIVTTREQCRTIYDRHQEERIEGYWVTYRYRGERYTTRMDRDPGEFVPVQLAVLR